MSPTLNVTFVDYEYVPIPLYVFLLNGIETGQIIFALLFSFLAGVVFMERRLCHRNLVIIIFSSLCLYLILLLSRLATCIYGFYDTRILGKLICWPKKSDL
jgi:hypothetical protein